MTQTVPLTITLGASYTGLLIGYSVLDIDRVEYSAFTTTNVAESSVAGTYYVAGGVVVPDAGGYIVVSETDGEVVPTITDLIDVAVDATAVNVTYLAGTLLTESVAGRLAAAFKKFFDVQTPVSTTESVNQGGDAHAAVTALAAVFEGITSLPKWLRGLFRKDAMDATAKAEVNASGGVFDEATDSLEAIRDRGDAAWSQSGSGLYSETITVDDGTNPLDGVLVQVATDAAYSNVIRSGYTNDLGQWTFRCDTPGTYYGRAELAGKNVREFTITVSA